MHKSYQKTVAILITCALIGALLCLPVSAVTSNVYSISIAQPPVGEEYGYIEVLGKLNGGGYAAYTFVYTITSGDTAVNWTNSYYLDVDATSSTLTFRAIGDGYDDDPWLSMYYVDSGGAIVYKGVTKDKITATFSLGIAGIHYYGNIEYDANALPSNSVDFTVNYGTDALAYEKLSSILAVLQNNNQAVIDNANQNAADIQQNADQNASDIQQNDDENTQSIIDNQNELAEQEKQEITDSGNQATDAAGEIPNESDGFIDALGTFVSTMSTTDTDCSITFPAIKIPSIAGIPAATLSEEKEVDFEAAIGLIPSDIMKLIQALMTIALIVFCFKELYDTISEALTRKKANEG